MWQRIKFAFRVLFGIQPVEAPKALDELMHAWNAYATAHAKTMGGGMDYDVRNKLESERDRAFVRVAQLVRKPWRDGEMPKDGFGPATF